MAIREVGIQGADGEIGRFGSGLRITRRVRILMVLGASLAEACAAVVALAFVVPLSHAAVTGVALLLILIATRRGRDRLNLYVLDDLPTIVMTSSSAVFLSWLLIPGFGGAQPLIVVLLTIVASFCMRAFSHIVRRRLQAMRLVVRNAIVVGGGEVAASLVASMEQNPSLGLRPIAMLDDFPISRATESMVPVESMDKFEPAYVHKRGIDVVIVAFSRLREPDLLRMLRMFDRADCEVYLVPRLFEYANLSGDMDHIRGIPLARVRRLAHRSAMWHFKRASSLVLSAIALALLAPVLAVIAFAVWRQEPSAPILFRQTRITENGSEFTILKFRSMKPANEDESATKWNIANDDRLGKLGRFLRKTSLDELPQLFNVLRGDLDLVGPRPERPHFVRQFEQDIPGYGARHRIPAGLTGWAAIHGLRGDTSLFERAVYDNYYIENWSLWLDIKIMIRTVMVVLRRTGG